jgi:hypothetical protein
MGLSLGASGGGTSSSTTSSGTKDTANVYSPGQSSLQSELSSALSTDVAAGTSGTLSPGVQAGETTAADQINKTSSGLSSRVNNFLASRGFGASGTTGQMDLQSELGRQSALGANAANFATVQQNANSGNLLAALNNAFTSLGTTSAATGESTGSTSSWGVDAGAAVGVPGLASAAAAAGAGA